MRKLTMAALAFLTGSVASAQTPLTIDVLGAPGAGITTWTFSGVGITSEPSAVRDNTGNSFHRGDTGAFHPDFGNVVFNASYQDVVFNLTDNASITIGAVTEDLTGIFLDDDGAGDNLGIRAAMTIFYAGNEPVSWTGSGTVNVDINDFQIGEWSMSESIGTGMYLNDPVLVNFAIVPEPGTVAFLSLGAIGLLLRRRKQNRPRTGDQSYWSHSIAMAAAVLVPRLSGYLSNIGPTPLSQ